ncbi:hypothetical protein H2198_000899 [Neophaeococcomyces mojaviensis]|uniref:Uncharacterized protein n=1 Tax=Neophaeococcomyces mojaviensis TaxID=3383035 RepID=A0ACC3AIL8_9EURO|nr:hypothetical protein H2198_000899 [Knufia sp. JES_112]
MGQGQSSTDVPDESAPVQKDYYDLLGVERTATDDEIKKAYRRKALELHPDRNFGNVESATKLFAEIQAAYEILADPQERAWYDSHRDVLLRGEGVGGVAGEEYSYNMKLTTAEDVLKLMMRFNKNVHFTDSPSGFFGGLNDFCKQLAKEEDVACQWQDLEYPDYPEFGSKDDDYEDIVRPFYAAWAGFATKKSYSWKDQYRLSDAPDRRIRRLMEKENQKLRDEAVQEYNDAVRSLIAFVRKRDPRVQSNQKSEAERQKALREAAAAQAARARAQRQKELEKNAGQGISAWAQSQVKDEHEGGFTSEEEIEEHEYECVVCDKTFKSEAQFNAHEKSKKHIKLLKELKREMRKEGKDLDLDPEKATIAPVENETEEPNDEVEQHQSTTNVEPDHIEEESSDPTDDWTHVQAPVENGLVEPVSSEEEGNDDYAPRSTVGNRLVKDGKDDITSPIALLNLEDTPAASGTESPSQLKLGKAKQKKAKKAAQQEAQKSLEITCAVCGSYFSSKTKLFDHLKENPDHAAPIPQTKAGGTKGGKGKKK